MSKITIINKQFGELKINNKGYFGIHKDIVNAIEQLQQENKELKEQNESLKKYYEYDNKSWKNLAIKQAHDFEIKNNILTEFEKWLEEQYSTSFDPWFPKILNKLKELKEGKK